MFQDLEPRIHGYGNHNIIKIVTLARSSINDPVAGLHRIEYAGVDGLLLPEWGSMYAAGPELLV